jgi:4a-hydroxytetrahydrobiopterin dehydratase
MAPITPLTPEQRHDALQSLPAWTYDESRLALYREIVLGDFAEAFALMTRIAIVAEKADHHPEWSNVYNRVRIWLTTHDAGGVSARDLDLATAIDGMAPTSAGLRG